MSTAFINLMKEHDFPDEIIEVWNENKIIDLLPIQREAINQGLFSNKNFLIVAPTSSGKTFIGEMASINYSYYGKKSIYLVPFKAIAEEKYDDFSRKYSGLGINIKISDRDHREEDDDIRSGDYDLAILTYEKLSGMLIVNPDLLNNCDCIIVDEVQMLGDSQRGGSLELLLTKIKEFTHLQVIALSAVLDDLNGFDVWLDAKVIKEDNRPVELRQGVFITGNGTFEYKEWNSGKAGIEQINATDMNGLIKYLLDLNEQIVIIKNSVASTQKMAIELMEEFYDLPAASKIIGELKHESESETRDELITVLRNSIAFHNADCEPAERRIVEKGFRDGHIRIIVATTTISAGVNLPCKTVILADDKKWSSGLNRPQKVNWGVGEVRNIFGRAGRLGEHNEFGRGIFIATNSKEKETLKRTYLNAPLESLTSTFAEQDIDKRVLDVVASGFGDNETAITNFIFKTYAARSWNDDLAKEQIANYIKIGIEKCLRHKLIEVASSGELRITDLGKVCASLGCKIETISVLEDYLTTAEDLNSLELLLLVSKTEEVSGSYYRFNWKNQELKDKIMMQLDGLEKSSLLSGICLHEYEKAKDKLTFTNDEQFKSFVCALLSNDIINTNLSISMIKRGYGFSTANIRNITLNVIWILEVLSRSAAIFRPDFVGEINEINLALAKGTPINCNHLNTLPVQLTREDKIRLVDAGYETLDDFIDKESSDFQGIINPTKVDKIIQSINSKREKNLEYWKREHIRRGDILNESTELIKELYDAQGIPFEYKLVELLGKKFLDCETERITDQRNGEPDILLLLNSGERVVIQVTAKEDNTKFIEHSKAADVLTKSESFNPHAYICLGKPDFQDNAISHATKLGKKSNFKLLTISCFVELYLRVLEEKISVENATKFIKDERGYLDIRELNRYTANLTLKLKSNANKAE
ncbi:DEAD/DEAH box helicase [Paenibacillus sp. FSL R7-0272]|uniref:DEAD/DEAH box helicase n=1 Tax=Paenibacillus sp. FSL R7-0272 TaxID=2921679 RepID=UPI0030ECBE07